MGLRPLHAGMIYGSGPFIPRDAGQGLYIYIHLTQHIYMCVHMSCLSHARVVPILDAPTVPRVRDQ